MKILMIAPQFRPLVGGYELAAERLASILVRRGSAVTILAERRHLGWPRREDVNGVKVRRWFCVFRPGWHTATSILALCGALLRFGPIHDVWHVHQYGVHSAMTLLLGRLLRRPVVIKITSSGQTGIGPTLAAGRVPKVATLLHRKASAIVALTNETASEVRAFGVEPRRIHLLGNGVDTETFSPLDPARRECLKRQRGLDARRVIVCVGGLRPEKNIAGLLDAWHQAVPRLGDAWTLLIVGDGPERQRINAQICDLNLGSSVRMIGPTEEVCEWLAVADLFVSCSRREGLSNALLEALSTGLPVVVTNVSGASECVEQPGTGLVVPVDQPTALSDALVELAHDDERRVAMGARARRVAVEKFSIERIAESYETLYVALSTKARAL